MTKEKTLERIIKEKFIKVKKDFKDGDFFKIIVNEKTTAIGCFENVNSTPYGAYVTCHFLYFVLSNSFIITKYEIMHCLGDMIKASPQEVMLVVENLRKYGYYYDRKARKVRLIMNENGVI